MGITTDQFFENIYSIIFSPKAFFENKEIKISLRVALGNVVFVAFISKLAMGVFDGSILSVRFVPSFIWTVLSIVVVWFLTALFFEYTAKIYSKNAGMEKILFYTSYAPVPYILFAPLNLFKHAGEPGYVFASLTELILYFWIITLYAYSLKAVYSISLSRAFMVIFLPFVSVFFVIYWLVCFSAKLGYIFSI